MPHYNCTDKQAAPYEVLITHEFPLWKKIHDPVRDESILKSYVLCFWTNLHSIFLGGQTAWVFHSNVTAQPRVSLRRYGLPIPAFSSHVKIMVDSFLAVAIRGRVGKKEKAYFTRGLQACMDFSADKSVLAVTLVHKV